MQAKMELRLGENYYDTEEISRGFDYLLRALEWCVSGVRRRALLRSVHSSITLRIRPPARLRGRVQQLHKRPQSHVEHLSQLPLAAAAPPAPRVPRALAAGTPPFLTASTPSTTK